MYTYFQWRVHLYFGHYYEFDMEEGHPSKEVMELFTGITSFIQHMLINAERS